MTVELAEIVRLGTVALAAVATSSVGSSFAGGVSLRGAKRPVAVLVRRDKTTMAFEIDGRPIASEELERRFPGQRAEFERRAMAGVPHTP